MNTIDWYKKGEECGMDLAGTCMNNVESWLEENSLTNNPPMWFYEGVDEIVFSCEDCGWWCEVGDESSESEDSRICNDCAEVLKDIDAQFSGRTPDC